MTDNVIQLPVAPHGECLPIVLGGDGPYECSRCSTPFVAVTWHVEPGQEDVGGTLIPGTPVCPPCARRDPELKIWQQVCDIGDRLDELMQAAGTFQRRALLVDLLAGYVDHFARWRADDAEMARWERRDREAAS
jgi:hypothetical protein